MPLDVVRLRDSDLVAMESAEAFRAAVMLWCASWHQVPAGSLPDDDRVLSNLAGYGRVVKEWQKERDGALRGWIKCSDGRLYHPVVAEKAVEAWRGKLERVWRTECARMKKHCQRYGIELDIPDFENWMAAGRPQGQALHVPEDKRRLSQGQEGGVPRDKKGVSLGQHPDCPASVPGETGSKGQGEGQGEGQGQLIQEKEPPGSSSAEPTLPPCPHESLIAIYHEVLPELPQVRLATADRRKALLKTWRWVLTSRRADGERRATTADEARAWFRDYFTRARANDFLMGRTPRAGEHANWRCDLDFLLTDRGLKHVIERTPDQP